MAELDIGDEREFFTHAIYNQYGAVVTGGSAADREEVIRAEMRDETTYIDGREITDFNDFIGAIVQETGYMTSEEFERTPSPGSIEVRRSLQAAGTNLVVLEFDAMTDDAQKNAAQLLKGVVEHGDWDEGIAFTAENGGAVVQANRDLSGRVKSYELTE